MNQIMLQDPEIAQALCQESLREMHKLQMIASENFTSPAVCEAQGTILTNKYAEGYPGRREYGGCEYIDVIENLALERAKKIFHADFANVQPYSGSQANMAAFFTLLSPGDTILSMNLQHGGHLSHGSPENFSGRFFNIVSYGVERESGLIDYDQVEHLARTHHPALIIAGASSYSRTIDFARFRQIADEYGAKLLADIAHIAGLVAAGEHPSPVGIADIVTTTTHKTLRGPRGGMILATDPDMSRKVNRQVFPGLQGGPHMHVIAAKAVAFGEAMLPRFREYQKQVKANARALAQSLRDLGFTIISGGTDNHLLVIDLTDRKINGKEAEQTLDIAGITVNKEAIPFDTAPAFLTSGIRLGTPALTTRGMKEEDMEIIAAWIDEALRSTGDPFHLESIGEKVQAFADNFPLFAW